MRSTGKWRVEMIAAIPATKNQNGHKLAVALFDILEEKFGPGNIYCLVTFSIFSYINI